jgi:hypothetical protein
MLVLQKAPFNLAIGKAILVKVAAVNRVGVSPVSAAGGTAVSAVVPDAPVALARNDAMTTTRQITFSWQDGEFDGASQIIDY